MKEILGVGEERSQTEKRDLRECGKEKNEEEEK